MKGDIQSAIASMEKTTENELAIEDLTEPEAYDVFMGKITYKENSLPALGVEELNYVSGYLLIPEDSSTTLTQMEQLDIIDHDGVTSNILIKSQEAAVLHHMNRVICAMELHYGTPLWPER